MSYGGGTPRGGAISDEQVGRLLASQARCEKQGHALETKMVEQSREIARMGEHIDALLQKQVQDDIDKARAHTGLAVGRWILGGVLSVLISVASWLLMSHLEHQDRLIAQGAEIQHVSGRIERQERSEEQTRTAVVGLQGDVRAIGATMEEVTTTLRSVDTRLRERRHR